MNRARHCVLFVLFSLTEHAAFAADSAANESQESSIVALVVPLLAIVFGLAALWWMLRRQGGRGSGAGPLRIVQVVGVGPRERVLVVDCDSRRLVLGITASTITLLTELATENAASNRSSASVSQMTNTAST